MSLIWANSPLGISGFGEFLVTSKAKSTCWRGVLGERVEGGVLISSYEHRFTKRTHIRMIVLCLLCAPALGLGAQVLPGGLKLAESISSFWPISIANFLTTTKWNYFPFYRNIVGFPPRPLNTLLPLLAVSSSFSYG